MTLAPTEQIVIAPQAGQQTKFAKCTADLAWFGGVAGCSKTYSLLMEAVKWVHLRRYEACIFRRQQTDTKGSGGLWNEGRDLYESLGGRGREDIHSVVWDNTKSLVQFSHLHHERDTERAMQGRNLAFAAFDELTHFTEFQWWYVYTRLRSQCGINPYMRGTLNPEPDSWVTTYLKDLGYVDRESGYAIPEMDGAIKYICRHDGKVLGFDSHSECHTYLRDIGDRKQKPRSFTYIAGKLAENKIMLAENPDYESNLAMSDAATVARLLYGNFNARAEPGSVFDRTWFDVIQDVPDQTQWLSAVRGWDRAGSKPSEGYRDPDWTRSVLLVRLKQGPTAVLDCTGLRDTPGAVDKHLLQVARLDGPRVIQAFDQDPGQAGVREREQIEKMFKEHLPSHKVIFQPTGGKDKALRARPFAAHCRNERMLIVNRPWSSEYLAELERFPTKGYHDDQVDASSTAYRELGFGAPDHAARFIAAHRHAKP